jgi:type IV secretion system protein VirB8
MTKDKDALVTYFQDGERWETEIVKRAKRSRSFAWFITLVLATISLLSVTALVLLVPLKSFEPYIVEVDKSTGYTQVISGLTRPKDITEQEAVTQANVVRYIRSREGYDPYNIEGNFGLAALLSTANAALDLQNLYSAGNPDNPAKIYGKNKSILVTIKSVSFPNASTALVRFSTDEKSQTDTVTRNFISVVRFRYTDTPMKNEWRFDNPLGFQVYDYRRDQETVAPQGANP